jgi:glycosyltransferase involved in cell wall biosynthesis
MYVSAILLAYDRPNYLAEALESVARQTRLPDEVVVVDDASPVPLEDRVEPPPNLNLRFVRHLRNSGPGAAAATGIRATRGDLVSFLNDDDLWHPTFVETMAGALESSDVDVGLVFCDHGVVDPSGTTHDEVADSISRQYKRAALPQGRVDDFGETALVDQSVGAHSFAMARRHAIDPRYLVAGGDIWDYYVSLSVFVRGFAGSYIPDRLGWYRVSDSGVSASWSRPEKKIHWATRRLAAEMLALRSNNVKLHSRRAKARALRFAASACKASLTSANMTLGLRLTAAAILRPLTPPPR